MSLWVWYIVSGVAVLRPIAADAEQRELVQRLSRTGMGIIVRIMASNDQVPETVCRPRYICSLSLLFSVTTPQL